MMKRRNSNQSGDSGSNPKQVDRVDPKISTKVDGSENNKPVKRRGYPLRNRIAAEIRRQSRRNSTLGRNVVAGSENNKPAKRCRYPLRNRATPGCDVVAGSESDSSPDCAGGESSPPTAEIGKSSVSTQNEESKPTETAEDVQVGAGGNSSPGIAASEKEARAGSSDDDHWPDRFPEGRINEVFTDTESDASNSGEEDIRRQPFGLWLQLLDVQRRSFADPLTSTARYHAASHPFSKEIYWPTLNTLLRQMAAGRPSAQTKLSKWKHFRWYPNKRFSQLPSPEMYQSVKKLLVDWDINLDRDKEQHPLAAFTAALARFSPTLQHLTLKAKYPWKRDDQCYTADIVPLDLGKLALSLETLVADAPQEYIKSLLLNSANTIKHVILHRRVAALVPMPNLKLYYAFEVGPHDRVAIRKQYPGATMFMTINAKFETAFSTTRNVCTDGLLKLCSKVDRATSQLKVVKAFLRYIASLPLNLSCYPCERQQHDLRVLCDEEVIAKLRPRIPRPAMLKPYVGVDGVQPSAANDCRISVWLRHERLNVEVIDFIKKGGNNPIFHCDECKDWHYD
jgi:hypothetical protein